MKKILLTIIGVYSIVTLQAQDAVNQFTLKQAIDYATQNHPNIKNAILDEAIAKKKVSETVGIGTPQIEGNAEINKFIEIPTSFVPAEFFGGEPGAYMPVQFGQKYSSSVGLTASQLLFDGSYLVGLKATRTYTELSRKATIQTKTEVVANVTKAYYGVLVFDARMKIIEAHLARLQKIKSDTKSLYENGFAEKVDVDRLTLAYNNLQIEKDKIDRYKTIGIALLKFQMGFDQQQPITLTDVLDESLLTVTAIPDSINSNNRPEFVVLSVSRQLQELDLKRYKSTYFPSLVAFGALSANAGRNEFDIFDTDKGWFPTAIVGLKLSVPIWDGLQKQARVSQAKLNLAKVDNSIQQMKSGFAVEFANSKTNWMNAMSSLELVKKNQELAKEILRISKAKFDNGVGSSLELTEAESAMKEADANYFTTLYDAIIAKTDLDKSLGNLKY